MADHEVEAEPSPTAKETSKLRRQLEFSTWRFYRLASVCLGEKHPLTKAFQTATEELNKLPKKGS